MTSITSFGKQTLNTIKSTFTPAPAPAAKPEKAVAQQPAAAAPKDEFVASEPKAAPVALTTPEKVTSHTQVASTSSFNLPGWVTDNPIVTGVQGAVNGVKDFANDVTKSLDVKHNIQQLGAGDKYTIGVKGNASARGLGGELKYKTEVEAVPVMDPSGKPVLDTNGKPTLKYTVSMDGELGVGLMGGVKGGDGKLLTGGGGKVEMSFDTAEEATRAAELAVRMSSTQGTVANIPGSNLTAEELKFLQSHMSAVEVRGTSAVELAAELGIAPGVSTTQTLGVTGEQTMRVEFNPPAVVMKDQGQVTSQTGVAVGGGGATVGVAGANTKITVATELRYELPPGTDVNALKSDPLGTIKRVGVASVVPASEKLTLSQELEGQVVGNGGGYKHQLVITEGVDAAVAAGVVQLAQTGDWNAALRAGGDKSAGEYTATTYTQHGLSVAPSLKVKGTGFSMEFGATRQDFASTPVQSYSFAGPGTKKAQPQASGGQK